MITGAVVGGLIGLIALLMCVAFIKKRNAIAQSDVFEQSRSIDAHNEPTVITPLPQLKYGQPMYQTNQFGTSSYGQPINQPIYFQNYNQPVYEQNYNQPNGWNSSSPFAPQNGMYGGQQQFGINLGNDPIIM